MRLICPNCGAQYEVDDALVPDTGRDVQCSNCGHGWYQRPPHLDQGLGDDLGRSVAQAGLDDYEDEGENAGVEVSAAEWQEGVSPTRPRATLDPAVRDILREEAGREIKARRDTGSVETQEELGLEPARTERRRKRVEPPEPPPAAERGPEVTAASRRDLLPDIEEINSSLRSADETESAEAATDAEPRKRGGFGMGFTIVIFAALLAVGVYAFADRLAAAVPAAEPALSSYVVQIDAFRAWLDRMAQELIARIG